MDVVGVMDPPDGPSAAREAAVPPFTLPAGGGVAVPAVPVKPSSRFSTRVRRPYGGRGFLAAGDTLVPFLLPPGGGEGARAFLGGLGSAAEPLGGGVAFRSSGRVSTSSRPGAPLSRFSRSRFFTESWPVAFAAPAPGALEGPTGDGGASAFPGDS